ncbi:profilin-like [Salvia divinorum]|uniref:Profilin n=1 Tax=Salvia divinorum TaxID=28513 RepID=A0ABD1G2D6_SALDI
MWLQSFLEEQLRSEIGDGLFLNSIAIVGQDGSVLAQTINFPNLKPNEVTSMMNEFDNPGSLAPTGLHIGGSSYFVIRGEAGAVIRGTGKNIGHNVTIKKTTLGLIIGIYEAVINSPAPGNMVVEEMGDYLIQQGL